MINEEQLYNDLRIILLNIFEELTEEETESLIWSNPAYSKGIFFNLLLMKETINLEKFKSKGEK